MRKLIIFLITAVLMGCNCLSQLPIQTLYVGESCEVALPDYRDRVSAKDNCVITSLMQAPVPGTILDAGNPYVNVVIIATDISNNKSSVDFDVVIIDTISPVIDVDTSLFACEGEIRFDLLDGFTASVRPFISDSIWYSHNLVMSSSANGRSVGGFYPEDLMMVPLTQGQVDTLLKWHTVTLYFDPSLIEPTPLTIDAGGGNDDWFNMDFGGQVGPKDIPGLDLMYRTERWGNFNYHIPIGTGTFEVQLHFAEIYWTEAGKRVFNVDMEGERVISNYDITAEVGYNVPVIKVFTTQVLDGWLDIVFTSDNDYGKISGIIITPVEGVITQL